jgi:hypothetical protein
LFWYDRFMNYFIAPRSGERSHKNYVSTIRHGVPYDNIEKFLDPEGKLKLLSEPVIYSWGNRAGTRIHWEQMEYGDKVIFYAKGELVMVGEVYYKQFSPQLALAMWPPDENNNPWAYTFFLKNLHYIKLPIKAFNAIAGYKSNFIIQGFMHLKGEHLNLILQQYGSIDNLLETFETEQSPEVPLSTEKLYVNLEKEIEPVVRKGFVLTPKLAVDSQPNKAPKKIDYTKRSKSNALTGSKGEALVVLEEKNRLKRAGQWDLAEKVSRVSIDDDTLGFDVLSFEESGKARQIEVKSTGAKMDNVRFYMSANEMAQSEKSDNYYIYFVDGVNTSRPRITPIKYPFESKFLITTDTFLLQAEIL